MSQAFLNRLTSRINLVLENLDVAGYKNPRSPDYDRQYAEDTLYNTIGPLTDAPRWNPTWKGDSPPPPDFTPGGPAPKWTEEEVIIAMAGDPKYLMKSGYNDHPLAPSHGRMGGAPVFRLAKRVAKQYARGSDKSFIEDMYGNGLIELQRLMQPGYDEGRSAFIPFVIKNIEGVMKHGVGGTKQSIQAAGGDSKDSGVSGIKSVLAATDPEQVRKYANQVKGQFQTTRSHAKNPDNPFGAHSPAFYRISMQYADALETGNPDRIEAARSQFTQLLSDIEESQTHIPGASTGMGQAISTPDRKSSIGISSMDVQNDDESGGSMAGNIAAQEQAQEMYIDPEAVYFILDVALNHDIGKTLANTQYRDAGIAAGSKDGKMGGKLTANELRYVIRTLGAVASNYPGKGTPRSNTKVPRDSLGWWMPGEDPEIEPLPSGGGFWNSIWTRMHNPAMGPTEIAAEMTDEVREFMERGIPTAREIKTKATKAEAVTKVSVDNTRKSALVKFKVIKDLHRSQLALDESVKKALRADGITMFENLDAIDRKLVGLVCEHIVNKLSQTMMG